MDVKIQILIVVLIQPNTVFYPAVANSQPHVKERQKIYHKAYYLLNKEKFKKKNRDYHSNRKQAKEIGRIYKCHKCGKLISENYYCDECVIRK